MPIKGREVSNLYVQKSEPYGILTISQGVASGDPGKISDEDLIKLADANLYKAKENGRNRVEILGGKLP